MPIQLDTGVHNTVMNQALGGNTPHVSATPSPSSYGKPFSEMRNAQPRKRPLWKTLAALVGGLGIVATAFFIAVNLVMGVFAPSNAATIADTPSTSAWPTVEAAPVVESVAIEAPPVPDTAAQMVFTMIRAWRPGERMVVQLDGDAIVCVDVGDNPNGIGAKIYNGDYTSCE